MIARIPIRTLAQANTLHVGEVLEGYFDGHAGLPEPGDNRSYSYWHGWRNGAVDGGHRQKDEAQAALAREVVNYPEKAREIFTKQDAGRGR